jgi:hypothetical protein
MSHSKQQRSSSVFELASEWAYDDLTILRGAINKKLTVVTGKPVKGKKADAAKQRKTTAR